MKGKQHMKIKQILRHCAPDTIIIMILAGTLAIGCATGGRAAKYSLVGSWTLSIDWYGTGDGEDHMLTINPDLTGTLAFPMGDIANIADVRIEGDVLRFTLIVVKEGQEFLLPFEGTIVGDTIKGEFGEGMYPADGIRIQPSR